MAFSRIVSEIVGLYLKKLTQKCWGLLCGGPGPRDRYSNGQHFDYGSGHQQQTPETSKGQEMLNEFVPKEFGEQNWILKIPSHSHASSICASRPH
eukprot:344282-Karenia_brevis.AAC.1